jgi:hypothetical protein
MPDHLKRLTLDQLDGLPNGELAHRMDEFLANARFEKYGHTPDFSDMFKLSVCDFYLTKIVTHLDKPAPQRKALYSAFDFVLQMEFLMVQGGATNKVVFDGNLFKERRFESPTVQLQFGALRQWSIVASRIAFEKLADLIHFLETGEQIRGKSSKFKHIRRIFLDAQKPWHYFAPYLIAVRRFDRKYRTPEVHGGSPMPRKLLSLAEPTSEELNASHQLTNLMMNLWPPFIVLLNQKRPNQFYGDGIDNEWVQAYSSGDVSRIEARLAKMAKEIDE